MLKGVLSCMQRPYLEEICFEETQSEADSLSSMDDDSLPDDRPEQPHLDKDLSSSAPSQLARSETKYFDAGEVYECRRPNMQLLKVHIVRMAGCQHLAGALIG